MPHAAELCLGVSACWRAIPSGMARTEKLVPSAAFFAESAAPPFVAVPYDGPPELIARVVTKRPPTSLLPFAPNESDQRVNAACLIMAMLLPDQQAMHKECAQGTSPDIPPRCLLYLLFSSQSSTFWQGSCSNLALFQGRIAKNCGENGKIYRNAFIYIGLY